MALTPQPLFRAQDVGTTTNLGPIAPKNWKVHANKVNFGTDSNPNEGKPRYNSADYTGSSTGDDVTQATANIAVARGDGGASETLPPIPRTQAAKATALGTTIVQDVGRNRGWIAPGQPYAAPPATPAADPVISTLSPNTAVAGTATPVFFMKITGLRFTPYSQVWLAGKPVPSVSYAYVSSTELRVQMSPAASVAGTATVQVVDHGVTSNTVTFTWT